MSDYNSLPKSQKNFIAIKAKKAGITPEEYYLKQKQDVSKPKPSAQVDSQATILANIQMHNTKLVTATQIHQSHESNLICADCGIKVKLFLKTFICKRRK